MKASLDLDFDKKIINFVEFVYYKKIFSQVPDISDFSRVMKVKTVSEKYMLLVSEIISYQNFTINDTHSHWRWLQIIIAGWLLGDEDSNVNFSKLSLVGKDSTMAMDSFTIFGKIL